MLILFFPIFEPDQEPRWQHDHIDISIFFKSLYRLLLGKQKNHVNYKY